MPRIIFETTSGNVVGVVQQPAIFDPRKPLKHQYLVKIGVIDPNGKLPKNDARTVINKLRDFVLTL